MDPSPLGIVLRYTPSEWQRHPYQDTLFIKVGINVATEEYRTIDEIVHNTFSNVTINKIQRIQHPFAYGRFHIRKQQLTLINKREPTVNRVFLSITDKSKLHSVLHYNCDSRRGGFSEEHLLPSNGFILIIKTLSELPCERDSDRYPEYLIAYRQIHRPPSDRSVVSTAQLSSSTSLTNEDSRSTQPTTSSYEDSSTKNSQSNYDDFEYDCRYDDSCKYLTRDDFAHTSSYEDRLKENLQSNYKNYEYDYQNDYSWSYLTRDNFASYAPTEGSSSEYHEPGSRWWLWIGAAVIVAYIYWRRSSE
ncbi:uncharacterized protein LOC116160462 [Photinus pyralis]|uniref:uncharacterized protein LOC116160462 n=1 Tax=Photinus pyralis TaxID=7054 RepID=UPI00126734CE|nr:uncharacterized protein LOC116160462 [Photinus pyralis]